MSQAFSIALISVLTIANVLASVVVLRASSIGAARKTAQLMLIWLVPGLGAVLIWSMHRSDSVHTERGKDSHFIENTDAGGTDH